MEKNRKNKDLKDKKAFDSSVDRERKSKRINKNYATAESSSPKTKGQKERQSIGTKGKEAELTAKSKSTAWSSPAKWYDNLVGQEGSEYHRQVVLPGVERLIKNAFGQVEGLNIADLACGQGVLCRRLAKSGANVLGIDLAPELIAKAENYNQGLTHKPQYKVMDITQLVDFEGNIVPELKASSFDVATLILSLQNIDHITALWRGISGMLQPDGVFIAVMMHPNFRIPQHSDWLMQSKENRQSRIMWSYLSSKEIDIVINPGQVAHGSEPVLAKHFHRPWQAYVNTMANAGLLVEHLEEWTSHKEEQESRHKQAKDTAREEFPLFLAFRCRKVDAGKIRTSIVEKQFLQGGQTFSAAFDAEKYKNTLKDLNIASQDDLNLSKMKEENKNLNMFSLDAKNTGEINENIENLIRAEEDLGLEKTFFSILAGDIATLADVGVDMVDIERIKRALDKWGHDYIKKMLSKKEYEQWQELDKGLNAKSLAGRWAAKEAVVKALGTGFSQGITWQQVQIFINAKGKPFVELEGQAKITAENLGIISFSLSITHEDNKALAVVIAQKAETRD